MDLDKIATKKTTRSVVTDIALIPKKDVQEAPKSLADIYEQHGSLVFLFDVSSSMASPVGSTVEVNKYLWPPEKLEEISTMITADAETLAQALNSGDPFAAMNLSREVIRSAKLEGQLQNGVEALKSAIIDADLMSYFSLIPNWEKFNEKPVSRLELVKRLAKREIEKRLKKNPKARIVVIRFDNKADILPAKTGQELLEVVDQRLFPAGGTDILNALALGLQDANAHPSPMHHFVLVTDGEDYNAADAGVEWVESFKKLNIVLDFIQIGTYHCPGMKGLCAATGGQYVHVQNESEFELRFVEMTTRKALPPPQ